MNSINKLLEVMARLRTPVSGCPWDLRQDFSTIAPYTVEEAYEVADAIDRQDMQALRDELGDLLFQVVFHARMAEEEGLFDFESVADGITQKMIRRHPHVFGSDEERAAGASAGSWDRIKAEERADGADDSALAGLAKTLPALKRAQKLGNRAAAVGFDWPDRKGVEDKISEELVELEEAARLGSEEDISISIRKKRCDTLTPSLSGAFETWKTRSRSPGANWPRNPSRRWMRPGSTPSGGSAEKLSSATIQTAFRRGSWRLQ
jgi:ATP diphosphatase